MTRSWRAPVRHLDRRWRYARHHPLGQALLPDRSLQRDTRVRSLAVRGGHPVFGQADHAGPRRVALGPRIPEPNVGNMVGRPASSAYPGAARRWPLRLEARYRDALPGGQPRRATADQGRGRRGDVWPPHRLAIRVRACSRSWLTSTASCRSSRGFPTRGRWWRAIWLPPARRPLPARGSRPTQRS